MKRKNPNLETKLAAALLQLGFIPYEHSKLLTANQICSLFQFDHWPIRVVDGGETVPWNLKPVLIAAHRLKTSKVDIPQVAKQKRIRERPLVTGLKDLYRPPPVSGKRSWPSRKMQSRPWPNRPD